ncbi:unnamed protein product [Blepharisma stoltei]|uniref:Uncharacterized protein n=1 Tax=Blepharisma stoltei TaxID=1481888 RepID=A0AAU9J6N5_9CILI|nr:unnamed protein product [Blepharisma stoltei]
MLRIILSSFFVRLFSDTYLSNWSVFLMLLKFIIYFEKFLIWSPVSFKERRKRVLTVRTFPLKKVEKDEDLKNFSI